MEEEYLWGLTLSSGDKEHDWDPVDQKGTSKEEKRDPTVRVGHRLLLKQAILSKDAKLGEVNVVEVEMQGYAASEVKIPIAFLKGGSDHQRFLDVLLPEAPVKFFLTSGDGPVHLVGSHCIEYSYSAAEDVEEEEDVDVEIDQEEVDDIQEDGDAPIDVKKRKAGKKPETLAKAKKIKMDMDENGEDEEDIEDEEEDDEEDWIDEVPKQTKKQGKLKKEPVKKQTAKKTDSAKKAKKVK